MRHHGYHRRHRGVGFGRRFGRFDRESMLERLQAYQRDLEQELADVNDLLKRLEDSPSTPPQTQQTAQI